MEANLQRKRNTNVTSIGKPGWKSWSREKTWVLLVSYLNMMKCVMGLQMESNCLNFRICPNVRLAEKANAFAIKWQRKNIFYNQLPHSKSQLYHMRCQIWWT
jgi:hypothetical protein